MPPLLDSDTKVHGNDQGSRAAREDAARTVQAAVRGEEGQGRRRSRSELPRESRGWERTQRCSDRIERELCTESPVQAHDLTVRRGVQRAPVRVYEESEQQLLAEEQCALGELASSSTTTRSTSEPD